jgi:hypothetical protein
MSPKRLMKLSASPPHCFAVSLLTLSHRELSSRPAEVNSAGAHPQVLGPLPQNYREISAR